MQPISREAFKFWNSLPETKLIQEAVREVVKAERVRLSIRLANGEQGLDRLASVLVGMERAVDFDELFQFEETPDAESSGTSTSD